MTYTDAQLVLLSAASQRDDGLLPRPAKFGGAVLWTLEASLVKAGAAEPIPVRRDQPTWRLDEAETPIGLRITNAALEAIGIEPAERADDARQTAVRDLQPHRDAVLPPVPSAAAPLRPGTKRALLVQRLSEAEGTSLQSLATALAWQPHTVRAALTRLRQDGFTIIVSKDAQRRAMYRIEASGSLGLTAKPVFDVGAVA